MNKNALLGLVVAVVVIGGIIYLAKSSPSGTAEVATTKNPVEGDPDFSPAANDDNPTPGNPMVITDPKAIPSGSTVVVTGKVTPNGASTRYWYEYSLSSNPDSKTGLTDKQSVGSGYVAISAPTYITGLTVNTTYYYRLIAENSFGKVSSAQYSFKTSIGNSPSGSVVVVKTLSVSDLSRDSATLNGSVNPEGAESHYWFEYGKTTDFGNTTALGTIAKESDGLDYDATKKVSASITNLEPSTTYYFRLYAQNQFGTVAGEVMNFKTVDPSAKNGKP